MSEWLPAATLAAGVMGTLGGQALTAKWTAQREADSRSAERQLLREGFQRETLLEMQDALSAFARTATQIRVHERSVFQSTGRYGREMIPEELDQQHLKVRRDLIRLRERVIDDQLRLEIRKVEEIATEVVLPRLALPGGTDAEVAALARQMNDEMMKQLGVAEDLLGELLRALL